MDIKHYQKRALEIREKYKRLEISQNGKEWTTRELINGFLEDVKELILLSENNSSEDKISHEISDCLWSVLVLADKFDIDLDNTFMDNMNKLEEKIDNKLKSYKD